MSLDSRSERYLVAGSRPWNRALYDDVVSRYPGEWRFAASAAELTLDDLAAFSPRYVFFLHWSAKVPVEVLERYECVCFHMTDVPYGRGGSPLQNLILRGHRETKLTALRMVEAFDAGPVYLKEPLSLEGSAQDIYERAGRLSAHMIRRIIDEEPPPVAQVGEPVVFKRRQPHESEITEPAGIEALYDFIRMLDADGYPHAFVRHAGFRFEFRRAKLEEGRIVAEATIVREPEEKP